MACKSNTCVLPAGHDGNHRNAVGSVWYNRLASIRLRYSSIDGVNKVRSFRTLTAARRWAHEWVGADAEVASSCYAISFDGVGKIEVIDGVELADLFAR